MTRFSFFFFFPYFFPRRATDTCLNISWVNAFFYRLAESTATRARRWACILTLQGQLHYTLYTIFSLIRTFYFTVSRPNNKTSWSNIVHCSQNFPFIAPLPLDTVVSGGHTETINRVKCGSREWKTAQRQGQVYN